MKKFKNFYNSKYFNVFLFLIYFVIPFAIYYDLLINNMVPFPGDGVAEFSMKLFMNNSLSDGELPFWNPYLSNGIPYSGNLNGAFYPISILLSWLPIKWFIYCFYALHLALGAFFTYLYLKEINCDKFVAICTSFIYLLSTHLGGFRKSHIGIITAVVYLPILLYYIEKFLNTSKIKYLIFSSIFMAMAVLSGGHIQPMVYTDIIVLIYFIIRMLSIKVRFKKVCVNIVIWGVTFLGIASIQLLPVLELITNYKAAGAEETAYQTFLSYSISPIKLIMMLFPYMFGENVYDSLGAAYSSGFDIEIFLGVSILLFVLFAIKNYYKDSMVKLSMMIMSGAFIFAANAHIPILSKIIYHIPILGGFRCSSRILFVFIFFGYVLFALSLSNMKKNSSDLLKFDTFVSKIFIFICCTLATGIPFIYILSSKDSNEDFLTKYVLLKKTFMKSIIIILTILIILKIIKYVMSKRIQSYKLIHIMLTIIVLAISVIETKPYSMCYSYVSVDEFEVSSPLIQNIKKNIGNNKLWFANQYIDGGIQSIIQGNLNVSKEIPAINSYVTFNNPRLFKLFTNANILKPSFNFSGLFTGFPDAKNNLIKQNDLLSMLGIKYILDSQNLIPEDGSAISSINEKEVIYENNLVIIPNQNGELYVFNDKINIEPNTNYKVSITINTDQVPALFYTDFYGGVNYDNQSQDSGFLIKPGKHEYEALINSGNSDLADELWFRIVTTPSSEIEITNIRVTKMLIETKSNVYVPYYIDEENKVFENTNAKDILYTPSSVVGISDVEDIYNNVSNYDLDDVSYVENIEDFTVADTIINNIVWKRNSITANVSADDSTFINFSQNYYPGWNAYIDGKKTELYMVNGLIQGIKVPEGEHKIIFRYIPTTLIIGVFILFVTILVSILLIKRDKKTSN